MNRKRRTTAALIFAVTLFAALASPQMIGRVKAVSAPAAEPAAFAATITLKNFSFTPKLLRVKAGTTVTWHNAEGSHTVTADSGAFSSPTLNAGQNYSFTFSTAGSYPYHCSFHGAAGGHDMAGTVVVTK